MNGVAQSSIDISIKDEHTQYEGKYLNEETKYWWKDLGEELEVDIEALDQNNSQNAST